MIEINGVEILSTLEELVDPGHTAILVIDMQNEIASERGGYAKHGTDISNLRRLIPNISTLLDRARQLRIRIVYTEFIHRNSLGESLMCGPAVWLHRNEGWISDVEEGTWEAQTVDELAPHRGDVMIRKSRASALYNTYLSDLLRRDSIRSVLLTGALSHGCVLKSAVDLEGAGYYSVVVRDCVASYDAADDEKVVFPFMRRKWPVFESQEIMEIWKQVTT